MSRWMTLIAAGALVAVPACGGAQIAAGPGGPNPSVQELLPASEAHGAPPPPHAPGAGRTPAPSTTPRAAVLAAGTGSGVQGASRGALPLEVAVDPGCVAMAGVVAVTITTVPDAALAMVIGYADGQPHGAMHIDDADGSGGFVWRVIVPPDAPQGSANVLVSSSNGTESAARQVTFAVAGRTGCG